MKRKNKIFQADLAAFKLMGYVLVFIWGMLCFLPFLLVVMNSFTAEANIMRNGYSFWPGEWTLEAYSTCLENPERIGFAYRNTIIATIVGTILSVLMSTMTGFVLHRKDFPWRNGFSFFFYFTTLFNGGLVPWYLMCTRYLGFKNNYMALVVPMLFSVWQMMLAKNFMKGGIPFEIIESAKVDGANDFTIYWKLVIPLAKPLIATLSLFAALTFWNDWYNCMLFMNMDEMKNLQYFLHEMLSSIQALQELVAMGKVNLLNEESTNLPQQSMKMAMTCITTGPILLLYPFVQKYFVKGLTIGAVKG